MSSRSAMPGFVIVVDTREQTPYLDWPTPWVRATLPSGDYSVRGFETRIAIERKRPTELFSCFGAQRDRFRREYERLSSYEYAAVVIEGTLEDCATRPDPHSQVNPHVIINSLISWEQDYKVRFHFAGNRLHAQTLTYRILQKFFNAHLEEFSSTYPHHSHAR